MMNTSVPPTYGDDFMPPPPFGHYRTLWDRWPSAEETADRGHRDTDKKRTSAGETEGTETLPPPSDETETPGMIPDDSDAIPDNLFEPDTNTPLPGGVPAAEPPAAAPEVPAEVPAEEPLPGLTPPGDIAPPADTPPADAPPADAPLPGDLFEERTPGAGAASPGLGSWESEEIPDEAPQGSLVAETTETARHDVAVKNTPTLAPPRKPATLPVQSKPAPAPGGNAYQKSGVRGASAIAAPSSKAKQAFEDSPDLAPLPLPELTDEEITEPEATLVLEPPGLLEPIHDPDMEPSPEPIAETPEPELAPPRPVKPATRTAVKPAQRVTEEPELAEPRLIEPQLATPQLMQPNLIESRASAVRKAEPELAEPRSMEPRSVESRPTSASSDAARWTRGVVETRPTGSAQITDQPMATSAPVTRSSTPALAEPRQLELEAPTRAATGARDEWKPTRSQDKRVRSSQEDTGWQEQTTTKSPIVRPSASAVPDRKFEQTSTRAGNPLR